MLRVVFFGTPEISAQLLEHLLSQRTCDIVGVVTRPDRPRGRSQRPEPSAVKSLALSRDIPLLQVNRCHQPDALEWLASRKADLFLVIAFGEILRLPVLNLPPQGCWNVHASLLPAYRGAAPMQWALRNGDSVSGVCIQKMALACDAGEVALEARVEIPLSMNLSELQLALTEAAKPLLDRFFQQLETHSLQLKSQDESLVSWAPKIELEDAQIQWSAPAFTLHNLIRSCDPEPGAFTWMETPGGRRRLRIFRSQPFNEETAPLLPGFTRSIKGRLLVGTGSTPLEILSLQPEGKKKMGTADYLNGCRGHLPTFFSTENRESQ